jgi:hypothetical protein
MPEIGFGCQLETCKEKRQARKVLFGVAGPPHITSVQLNKRI